MYGSYEPPLGTRALWDDSGLALLDTYGLHVGREEVDGVMAKRPFATASDAPAVDQACDGKSSLKFGRQIKDQQGPNRASGCQGRHA